MGAQDSERPGPPHSESAGTASSNSQSQFLSKSNCPWGPVLSSEPALRHLTLCPFVLTLISLEAVAAFCFHREAVTCQQIVQVWAQTSPRVLSSGIH
jgi:hypothetical protein